MAITDLDEQLLARAHQAGDERAFREIVRTQHRALYSHAYRRLGNHEAAEDAVQDTLLRAYRALSSFDGDLRLRAWLHRILTNVCHDEGNRRRRQSAVYEKLQLERELDAPDPVEEAVLHDTVRIMNDALADLPETYREALVLRYVDGLSFREVGEAVGITEENARARVHRGRVMLHKLLGGVVAAFAFLIPGLRRAQQPVPVGGEQAVVEHVSLVTQLTSHAVHAAPTVTRLAAEASSLPGGKSSLLAGAIAAAAAVSVPVAAYKVHEATQPDRIRTPAAVAPPADDTEPASTEDTIVVTSTTGPTTTLELPAGAAADAEDATGANDDAATEPDLPPSAARPFESDATTETTEAPTTTVAPEEERPPPPVAERIEAALSGADLTAVAAGPNVDLAGTVLLTGDRVANLHGRLSLYDDGDVSGELTITLDGVEHSLRLRGAELTPGDDGTRHFDGKFSLVDGSEFGFPESGDLVSGTFDDHGDGTASLTLSLEGEG